MFVHAPYLINLGSPSAQTLDLSARRPRVLAAPRRGHRRARVVVHAGNAVGARWEDAMAQARDALLRVLDAVPGAPPLLVEPTAGGGVALASDAASLGAYLDALGRDERVGVCLDTCHLHAAGHDLSTAVGFAAALRAYRRAAGPNRIGLVHVNDSRDPVGSKRDRHESIGHGTIGPDAFAALFTSPATRSVPMVVETVDTNQARDIATLKALRAGRLRPGLYRLTAWSSSWRPGRRTPTSRTSSPTSRRTAGRRSSAAA